MIHQCGCHLVIVPCLDALPYESGASVSEALIATKTIVVRLNFNVMCTINVVSPCCLYTITHHSAKQSSIGKRHGRQSLAKKGNKESERVFFKIEISRPCSAWSSRFHVRQRLKKRKRQSDWQWDCRCLVSYNNYINLFLKHGLLSSSNSSRLR